MQAIFSLAVLPFLFQLIESQDYSNNQYNLFILESEQDAKHKAATKPKRLIMQKKLTSSDTSDQENEVIDEHVSYVTKIFLNMFFRL